MRIPAIVAAATALTLGLGGTLAIGLTAAADPPPSWTVDITSNPLLPDGELTFSGTKPADSVPTDVTVTSGVTTESALCSGLDTDTFSCSYDPAGEFSAGTGTITILIGEAAFTVDFDVTGWATGAPSMSYYYSPAGVVATGTPTFPASKVAIEFFRYTGNESDQWEAAGGCPAPGYDGNPFDVVPETNSCSISDLAPGIYNPYSQQDTGDGSSSTGEFASDYFVVPPTPTITASINGDYSAYLHGTYPSDFVFIPPAACTYTDVYSWGDWYCTTGPLELGEHSFSAQVYDNGFHDNPDITDATYHPGGTSALATATLSVTTLTPAVDLSFDPGSVTVESTPRGLATVARSDLLWAVDYYDYYSYLDWRADCRGPNPIEGEGYGWDGDPFEGISPDLTDYGCTFPELSAGVWAVESRQDDGDGGVSNGTDSQYFVVPETPSIETADVNPDGSVDVNGYAPYGYEVHVIDSEGNEVCEPVEPDDGNEWSCTTEPLAEGEQSLRAYTVDTGAGEGSLDYSTYVTGGTSAYSEEADVNVVPRVPTMSYEFIPGGVIIDGEPAGDGTVVRVDWYSWAPGGEGGGFKYLDSCGGPDYPEGEGMIDVFEGITPGPVHCVFTDLLPGVWNPYSQQDTGDGQTPQNAWADDYFVVPVTPSITSTVVDAAGKVTVSGTTVPGNKIYVLNGASQILCTVASNTETGSWSCVTPALSNGAYDLRAYSEDRGAGRNDDVPESEYVSGGLSSLTSVTTVTVDIPALPETGGTTPTTPTTPTLITPTWFFSLGGVDLSNLHPGDKFTITGSGLPAGSKITAELHSTPTTLGTATVGSNGTFSLNATVPESTEPGDHTVVVTVTGDGLVPTTKEQPVKVTAESETAGHSAEGSGTAEAAHGEADAHGGAEGELSGTAPNILTNSMNPIIEVLNDPGRIPAAFAAGLVLIIFAILPAHLLNSTIAEQYERFARRVPALRTAPKWYTSLSAAVAKAPALGGVLLMAATGFLFAFADPKFGFNLHSLRLIIALSAALFVVFFVANWITATIMRRVWNVDVVVRLRPLGLILTVVGVIVSRILDFSPGFLVGVVLGLSIASTAAAEHAWKAVLIRASVVTAFGIGSWMIYSSIAEGVHHDPTFLNEVVLEFFVAIATEGIVLLLVELLPLHMLEGERLYKKSKVLWGAVYTVVLVVFILAVVPWEGNWRELGQSFWPWFTAVAIFGAVCVAIYLYFRFIAEPLHHDEHHDGSGPELEDDERIAVGNDS
jgi:hypothetical protein